jgi:hypothetical protein
MVNKPKNKGTIAETAVVNYLCANGWPYAERRAQRGINDVGDVTGIPGLCMEVKYGNGGLKIGPWLAETGIERLNSRAKHGILIVKPGGLGVKSVGSWYALMYSADFDVLCEDVIQNGGVIHVGMAIRQQFTSATLRALMESVPSHLRYATEGAMAFVLQPPGTMDKPGSWYVALTLQHMVRLLHAAGYGTGESSESDPSA